MAMVVANNLAAQNVLTTLGRNSKALAKELKMVSSGTKITGAADDASGYAISERMRAQIRSLDQANVNTQNGASLAKVAMGAIESTTEILRTMKEMAINSANDTNTDADRATLQRVWDQYIDQIDDNANVTFNGMQMLDGSRSYLNIQGVWSALVNKRVRVEDAAGNAADPNNVKLIDLKDFDGTNLGIQKTDTIVLTVIQQGNLFQSYDFINDTIGKAVGDRTLGDFIKKDFLDFDAGLVRGPAALVTGYAQATYSAFYGWDSDWKATQSPDGKNHLVVTEDIANFNLTNPGSPGKETQWSSFSIAVYDGAGNLRQPATAALNSFEHIRVENQKSGDRAFSFQIGTKANQTVKLGFEDLTAYGLGLAGHIGQSVYHTLRISTQADASAAIGAVDHALMKVLDAATNVGSLHSRLEYTSANLVTGSENTQSAESTIRDADMAREMTNYTKSNVLLQAAQSMLAQANQNASGVWTLLQ